MITRYRHRDVVWIDLKSPTPEEVREVMETHDIHPVVAEELLLPSVKPKVEFYDNHFIYLILHFPALRHSHSLDENQEIDFIVGRDFIITTRYDTVDPLHKFSKVFEVNSMLDRSGIGNHAGFVFYFMVKKLYRALEHEIEYLTDALAEAERKIFLGHEREMVIELSRISRDLITFKQAMVLHDDVLESLEPAGKQFFGIEFSLYLKSIIGEYYRVKNAIDVNLASLGELRETNNSLVSTKQNEVMKILTILAFVTFPLSLLASIFGMNTDYLPIVGGPNDFWIIIGIMVVVTACFFVFFKYKEWL